MFTLLLLRGLILRLGLVITMAAFLTTLRNVCRVVVPSTVREPCETHSEVNKVPENVSSVYIKLFPRRAVSRTLLRLIPVNIK